MKLNDMKLQVVCGLYSVQIRHKNERSVATIPYGYGCLITDKRQAIRLAERLLRGFNDSQKGE